MPQAAQGSLSLWASYWAERPTITGRAHQLLFHWQDVYSARPGYHGLESDHHHKCSMWKIAPLRSVSVAIEALFRLMSWVDQTYAQLATRLTRAQPRVPSERATSGAILAYWYASSGFITREVEVESEHLWNFSDRYAKNLSFVRGFVVCLTSISGSCDQWWPC